MFDINQIRKDFPILQTEVYGKPLVYLDNGATTQKPTCVVNKIQEMYYHTNANIHRGVHYLSQKATDEHENSRRVVQEFISASNEKEVIFTRGTTEAINLVASCYCRQFCREGDEIIISTMEHHSNIVPWQLQAEALGLRLRVIPMNEEGELLMEDYETLFSERTKLVSVMHISNVLGTVNPISQMIDIAHSNGVPVLVDAAQSVQHVPIDVQALDCDFLVFSGHKIYAPTGIGVLYGKEKWLEQLPPYQGGGEMIATVSFDKTTFNELPFKFEAGTPDYVGSTALATALQYVQTIGLDNIYCHEMDLLHYATDQLQLLDGVRIIGTAQHKASVVSFLVDGIHHYDMGMLLDKMGIAVRTGHHCAQPLMQRLGIEGTVRASFAFYNTHQEVDALIVGLRRIIPMFR